MITAKFRKKSSMLAEQHRQPHTKCPIFSNIKLKRGRTQEAVHTNEGKAVPSLDGYEISYS